MWVILPVKHLQRAKQRLASILTRDQRAHLSYLMLSDILDVLSSSDAVEGITVISSDPSVKELAAHYRAQFLLLDADSGYSTDAMLAISSVCRMSVDKIAIIPADVPQLVPADLHSLNQNHEDGLTLCPAVMDGGTNAVVFSPPLRVPLMFGPDSSIKYQREAGKLGVPARTEHLPGLERDMDRPDDLFWLSQQPSGKRAWSYIKELSPEICRTQGINKTDKSESA
ncbi:MAG: 2-phospho-L-lactate guanylyltransferase [Gammaproteobacteria bacterium]